MPDPVFLRIGAGCATVGGALAFVANLLHGPADASDSGLHQLAHNGIFGIYVADHVVLTVAVMLLLGGLSAISESITSEPGVSWARFGSMAALVGTAVMVVALGIDGFGLVWAAQAWSRAGAAEQVAAFQAIQSLWGTLLGIFALGILVYFGMTPLLYGLAFLTSATYPRWVAYLALLGGSSGLTLGLVLAFSGPSISFATYTSLYAIGSLSFSLWITSAGLLLWRRHRPALSTVRSAPETHHLS